jgi:hypothetical protein
MEIKTLLTKRNYTSMSNKQNKYIVIHYVGAVSSAFNNAKYFETTYRGASAHYFVDEKDIYQVVREKDASWHCGANKYKHPDCRNNNSIGIEMCCYRNSNGTLDVSEKVVERTIALTKELMAKYNIPVENVLRHYDVTGKNCPAPMVSDVGRWNNFKSRLTKKPNIKYEVHIQNIGWQEQKENGELAGTEGQALRIEAIKIHSDIPIRYRAHVENKGWQDFVSNGELAGTVGESLRLECIEIECDREIKATAHVQDIGWLTSIVGKQIKIGTEGRALRLEALT